MDDSGGGAFRGEHYELTEKILKAFYLVANELGCGFLESVYRRALCIALREGGLTAVEEAPIEVWFHGQSVGMFRADILVEDLVILELKTADEITKYFEAQLLHYLRATDVEVGMVLAFGQRANSRRLTFRNELKVRRTKQERG